MKRFACLLTALLLMMLLPVTAFAQGELEASDVTVKSGELVFITVSLAEPVEGTSLGVSSSYDTALLEAVPSDSEWKKQGLLSDFNEKGMGVWTTDSVMKLEGDMVVLAFRPLSDQSFSTEVVCTLIVKNGGNEVGRYTATAKVTLEQGAVQSTTPKTQPTAAPTEYSTAATETFPADSTGTAFYSESDDFREPTQPHKTEQPQADNTWIFWLVAVAAVGVAATVVIVKKKKHN